MIEESFALRSQFNQLSHSVVDIKRFHVISVEYFDLLLECFKLHVVVPQSLHLVLLIDPWQLNQCPLKVSDQWSKLIEPNGCIGHSVSDPLAQPGPLRIVQLCLTDDFLGRVQVLLLAHLGALVAVVALPLSVLALLIVTEVYNALSLARTEMHLL